MADPIVSIVTPTYNQAAYVAQTIESVLAQTYPHIEYIVLDDGSTDETLNILQRYRGLHKNIHIERHANIGQTATINKGWSMSQGDILAWINSDDLLTPHAVAEAVAALDAHPTALMVHGNCDNIDSTGQFVSRYPSKQETLESLLFFNNSIGIAQPSTFLRRQVLYDVGFLDPFVYWCMDLDYWLRLAIQGEMVYIDTGAWSQYRLHPASKTSSRQAQSAPDFSYIYAKLAAYGGLPTNLQHKTQQILAHGHWFAARRFLYGGDKVNARREAWKSLRMHPTRHLKSKMKLMLGRS